MTQGQWIMLTSDCTSRSCHFTFHRGSQCTHWEGVKGQHPGSQWHYSPSLWCVMHSLSTHCFSPGYIRVGSAQCSRTAYGAARLEFCTAAVFFFWGERKQMPSRSAGTSFELGCQLMWYLQLPWQQHTVWLVHKRNAKYFLWFSYIKSMQTCSTHVLSPAAKVTACQRHWCVLCTVAN